MKKSDNNKGRIITQMNEWGKSKIPFFFIIGFNSEIAEIYTLSELAAEKIFFDIEKISNKFEHQPKSKNRLSIKNKQESFQEYKTKFDKAIEQINLGNTYLINLTCETPITINWSLEEIYYSSNARYKLLYKNNFVVFSPEIFVKINAGIISSYPMKGTIDASIENAKEIILNDKKEIAEHSTIVDLIRNDLSIVAKDVEVKRFRYVEEIKTSHKNLLQVSSEICGKLDSDYNERIGDILFSLLPAGSISGAPKKKTVEIINKIEGFERKYYTGVFGYFDGDNLNSGVMIRFIEMRNEKYFYKSGGGITSFSEAESEYNEMIDKIYVPVN